MPEEHEAASWYLRTSHCLCQDRMPDTPVPMLTRSYLQEKSILNNKRTLVNITLRALVRPNKKCVSGNGSENLR